MSTLSCVELLNRWRYQINRSQSPSRAPRGLGVLGCLTDLEPVNGLVELKRVLITVLYDVRLASGHFAIRMAGYRASREPHGINWGGRGNARFDKDLTLSPRPGGGAKRIDLLNFPTTSWALSADRRINVALRYRTRRVSRGFELPRTWAGFPPSYEKELQGSGPELERLCVRFGISREAMLAKFRREHRGLVLYPLDWVSDHVQRATDLFAEVKGVRRWQVFGIENPHTTLVGFAGAATFDFHSGPQPGGPEKGRAGRTRAVA